MSDVNRRDVLQLGFVSLGIGMAGTLAIGDEKKGKTAAAPPPKMGSAIEAPAKLGEGLAQLERLLGKFDASNQRDFTSVQHDDEALTPQKGKSKIVRAAKGVSTLGTPCRFGEALAFDLVELWESNIYALDGDERKATHTQHSHRVIRYMIRPGGSGLWFFDASFVSSGSPRSIDAPHSFGSVKWYADGIELAYTTPASTGFVVDGKSVLNVHAGRVRFVRNGDELTLVAKSRNYELGRDPSGDQLQIPDFSKPIGEPHETIFKYVLSSNLA